MFAKPLARPDLRDADQGGFTREESDALATKLHPLSPRGLYWAATRAGMRITSPLSEGLRLGHATGFDSGSTLDYVYRNQPTGVTPLGRLIDRNYLGSIGWRGIRQRKVHIEELLQMAMADRAPRACPCALSTSRRARPPRARGAHRRVRHPIRSCCAITAN
jgi:hypothetical protein